MPRWKETKQILAAKHDGEIFDDNWMNYDRVWKYAPPSPEWTGDRPMRVEDVDVWEVITEMSGPIGVYAAWCPYGELYVVTRGWLIVEEFSGWGANQRLERYLQRQGIPYPAAPNAPMTDFEPRTLILA